jgi:hypothetical protein
MGIWKSIGRLITGEPVFQPGDQPNQGGTDRPIGLPPPNANGQPMQPGTGNNAGLQNQPVAAAPTQNVTSAGPKVLPLVAVQRIEPHMKGDQIEYYFAIENMAEERLELDKIRILNVQRELDNFLNPHEEREFLVYSGLRPTSTAYNQAEIFYKNEHGDYFKSTHHVEFDHQPDNTYTISRVRFVPPVRDV